MGVKVKVKGLDGLMNITKEVKKAVRKAAKEASLWYENYSKLMIVQGGYPGQKALSESTVKKKRRKKYKYPEKALFATGELWSDKWNISSGSKKTSLLPPPSRRSVMFMVMALGFKTAWNTAIPVQLTTFLNKKMQNAFNRL